MLNPNVQKDYLKNVIKHSNEIFKKAEALVVNPTDNWNTDF
tara:strand:- start:58 stop:180 length:123 start_codon:yes stop_codon:yes gene_type:complete